MAGVDAALNGFTYNELSHLESGALKDARQMKFDCEHKEPKCGQGFMDILQWLIDSLNKRVQDPSYNPKPDTTKVDDAPGAADNAFVKGLQAIASDPIVVAAMNNAWNQAMVDGVEHGFFIVAKGKDITIVPFTGEATIDSVNSGIGVPKGEGVLVVTFHTHQNPIGTIDRDPGAFGQPYATGPSFKDERTAKDAQLAGIIRSYEGIHYYLPSDWKVK